MVVVETVKVTKLGAQGSLVPQFVERELVTLLTLVIWLAAKI